jgi:N-acetylmuramoyl-L-alanine amidase
LLAVIQGSLAITAFVMDWNASIAVIRKLTFPGTRESTYGKQMSKTGSLRRALLLTPYCAISSKLMRGVKRFKTARSPGLLLVVCFTFVFQSPHTLEAACAFKVKKDIKIVLDVGHTASDSGATSARGVREYEFNMKLAQRIKEKLFAADFHSTQLLITAINDRSGLYQRVNRANNMNADIFLSIHHDSVRDEYLERWVFEGEEHFFFDGASGFSLHVSSRNVKYGESLRLAQILADQLIGSGLEFTTIHEPSHPEGARKPFVDSTRGIYQRDDLAVLSYTEMPAVLLESGVIANRDEELVLSSEARRRTVAAAIVEAINKFCGPREAPSYRVIDVKPFDVLNIRSEPNTDASIVGTIPHNGRDVRLVGACEGNWCPIDYNGVRGWVNSHFLHTE